MKRKRILVLTVFAVLLVFLWLPPAAGADRFAEPAAPQAGAPTVVSYQGQVTVGGAAYTGFGYFKFAVVNAAGNRNYWTNDGTNLMSGDPPANSVVLRVSDGLFNVLLGDTAVTNMVALPASAFAATERYLRVWFSQVSGGPYTLLAPDRRIAAVPFALQAEEATNAGTLDGHNPGNASGNVPLNNGTLNTDLNADLLDGQHGADFAASSHSHDHGGLTGLGDDDHPQYFNLSQNETVSGRPAFNGGTSGSSAPFTVDSSTVVANLNTDLLDGQHGSYYQARVSGTCSVGSTIRGINADGTVTCQNDAPLNRPAAPANNTRAAVDSTGDVGFYTSITIGADGLGLISYLDTSNEDLKVAHCNDAACASTSLATVDSAGDVGYFTAITIGADGLGLISYYDDTNGDLKVAHCNDAACASASLATVDSAGDVGYYTAITIGADGLGLISYVDYSGDLKVAHCTNTACASASLATVDSAGDVGWYTSITIGADGLGLISYFDATNGDLKVAHCNDAACASASLATLDGAGNVGSYTSITIGADGLGLISYYDNTNDDLKVAHCNNAACASASLATVDSAGDVGRHTSITIGADGLGLISYDDATNYDLKVAHCANAFCTPYFRRR